MWGAIQLQWYGLKSSPISTHAPAWGATSSPPTWGGCSADFYSRPREGGDEIPAENGEIHDDISTHAPRGGRRARRRRPGAGCTNFYSRPRIGGAHTGAARHRQKPACDSRERGIGSQSSTAEPVLSVGKRVSDNRGEGIRLKADLHAAGHLV